MALFRRSSSDAHWSKDYIEHLRSVHFVLIAVAVTCIAVSRMPDIKRLENADNQIHRIMDASRAQDDLSSKIGSDFITISLRDGKFFGDMGLDQSVVQL